MKAAINSLLIQIYHHLLRLYPDAFQEEYGAEMESVFAEAVAEAAARGTGDVAAFFLQEMVEFPANLVGAYRRAAIFAEVGVVKREASWNILPVWVGLNLLSIPTAVITALALVIVIDIIIGPISGLEAAGVLQAAVYISSFILVTAVLQWLLLRRYLRSAGVWIPLTVLGWLAGILLLYLVSLAGGDLSSKWLPIVGPLSLGTLVGVLQWLYLRRVVARAGYWVLASAAGYGILGRGGIGSFTSIPEFLFFILVPFAVTGAALYLLLRSGQRMAEVAKQHAALNKRRLAFILLAAALIIPLFFAGSLVYARGQLALAKAQGIYATPEEGMTQELLHDAGRYPVQRVDIISAGPNSHDGSQPHVWFVTAHVFADHRPDGKYTPQGYGGGSFFLRVEDGWVHMPEGAIPQFVGWVMTLYGLEGA